MKASDVDYWIRGSLWTDLIKAFDEELDPDLSNSASLCSQIPLRVFGQILLDPASWLKRSAQFLPTMPSDDVQNQWTGNSGVLLLEQSVDFIETVVGAAALAGLDPRESRVLDFGIGWGRLARLWLKYAGPEWLEGCDAHENSLDKARECGLRNRLVRSDPLLNELPYPESTFSVIWAFSVFTHLRPDAMLSGLSGLRSMLDEKGIVVFTVRPHSYWDLPHAQEMMSRLGEGEPIDTDDVKFVKHLSDDPYYGDISVSHEFLTNTSRAAGLEIVSTSWSARDPYQVAVIARRL